MVKGNKGKKKQPANGCCRELNNILSFFLKNNQQEIRFFIGNTEYLVNNINNFDLVQCVINGSTGAGQPITLTCDQLANVDPKSIEVNI